MIKVIGLALVTLTCSAAVALGASTPSMPSQQTSAPRTPQQIAIEKYNSGLRRQAKALKLEEKSVTVKDADRAKSEGKVRKEWEAAIKDFAAATQSDPRMYQAWSGLGHAYRKAGRFDESLNAYDKSLAIEPRFAEAIEYRAEAYLGLNRVEDAKAAYLVLFAGDRPRADELAQAMKKWVEERRANPAGADPAAVESLASWLSERGEIASQNTGLLVKDASRNW